ncbi:MAG: helix-turn-helix transcriptional regulator [Selenomonadales bacterium]|nr:helix-turn-helix transcriptional regulator [Selenomonadales bacterium]
MILGRIKQFAAEKNLSLYAIEKKSGMQPNTIAKWATHAPSVYKAKAVADVLEVPLDELVREK